MPDWSCFGCLQDQGIGILFTSFQWGLQQQQPGKFNFRLMDYVQRVVCESGTKLAVVLDANASPPWVSQRFPDGLAVDAKGVKRGSASFFHGEPRQWQLSAFVTPFVDCAAH